MRYVLIIAGPTASGKTALSELVAKSVPSEIINADIGQFYSPLSVGTAKPDLSALFYKAHGFDILDGPRDLSVVAYRSLVTDLVDQIHQRDKLPVLVGGSLFYIKSLFFPPIEPACAQACELLQARELSWQALHKIDPERALQIHPNDGYRIQRALDIWHRTGIKPSTYKPVFNPPFKAKFIFVCPEREILNERIKVRMKIMIQQGWIAEAEKLMGTEWEPFLQKKGLIGYPELINWIRQGKQPDTLDQVIKKIEIQTTDYAKRQVTFWKSFAKQLEDAGACEPDGWCSIQLVSKIEDCFSINNDSFVYLSK